MLKYEIIKSKDKKIDKYVLMLHCICGTKDVFKSQIESLRKKYNILLLDLPYHGENVMYEGIANLDSITDDIIMILNKNGIEKVTLVGLSLGCSICNSLCFKYPERLEKVLFLSAANGVVNKGLTKVFVKLYKVLKYVPFNMYLKFFVFSIIPNKQDKKYRIEFYRNAKIMGKENVNKAIYLLIQNHENFEKYMCKYLNELNIPKIFICGNKDYIFKNSVLKNISTNDKNKVIILDKSHMLDIYDEDFILKYLSI